jgi:predicted RNA-binding Zn-ribbon protein involved in translation (DUF1610 family)
MPKCPNCGKEIDFLKNYVSNATDEFNFSLNDKGKPVYEYVDTLAMSESEDDNIYACPECGQTLFTNEKDAIEFLKGKK